MPLNEWWKKRQRGAGASQVEWIRSQGMDGFADSVLLELKGVTGSAIAQAIQERESHYMRSILEESVFWLDSLEIRALDAQTARDMDRFIADHESIHPDFRGRFFSQILQPEYRSSRGATVRVKPGLLPVIQLDPKALDAPTQDEDFIISLKGRKVRFEAVARLSGPVSKAGATAAEPLRPSAAGPSPGAPDQRPPASPGRQRIHVAVRDRSGLREELLDMPLVLGREGVHAARQDGQGAVGLDIDATYVSRKQLVVFELLGQVYCTVPAEASLTCSCMGSGLKPLVLLPLRVGQSVELQTGLPVDALDTPIDRGQVQDHAVITLRLGGHAAPRDDATPRPRAVR